MQARAPATRQVCEARVFVDDDIVAALYHVVFYSAIEDVGLELDRRIRYVAEAGEVEDLHAMSSGSICDNVRMVLKCFNVPPKLGTWCTGCLWKISNENWVHWISDVDE